MNNSNILDLLKDIEINKIVFSDNLSDIKKLIIKKILLNNEEIYQIEYFSFNKAYHINIKDGNILTHIEKNLDLFKQILVISNDKEYVFSKKKNTFKMKINDRYSKIDVITHDKQKKYFLNEGDDIEFLKELGIMNKDNMVYKKSYNKFRQINKYLEIISSTISEINLKDSYIRILDFGCGKSYLSFATYYYLKEFRKDLKFDIIGLDLKKDVIENCNKLAKKLNYTNISFLNGDIKDYKGFNIDLVFSLHACNNATDYSILKALELNSKAFLAVPCCHNEFYKNIKLKEDFNFLNRDKIILEKFSTLVTESYRKAFLEMCGYEVLITEFIDIEYTAKNLLIKAIKKNKVSNACKIKENYYKIKDNIGFTPLLENIAKQYIKEGGK